MGMEARNIKADGNASTDSITKVLKDLKKQKKKFIIPEAKEVKNQTEDVVIRPRPQQIEDDISAASFQDELDTQVKRDQKTISFLNLALKHARVYDSKETALEIMNKAYNFCPSVFNKKKISYASQSLKAAIKAEKWAKSRKRRRHVDEHTVQKNVNTFYEKVSEAVLSISIEIEKRTNQLFKRVKEEYASELPLSLSDTKSYTKKKAHVIANCVGRPIGKSTHLEAQLYLLSDVTVIGINSSKTKDTLKKAETIASKIGTVIHPAKLGRPSENIDWYLVSNFGVKITVASFADALYLSDSASGGALTYEDYIKGQEAENRIQIKLRTQRLRALRTQFAEDNSTVHSDIKALQGELANLEAERDHLKERFNSITMVSDTDKGLTVNQYRQLNKKMEAYRESLILKGGMTFVEANVNMIKQRIEARSYYLELEELTQEIRKIKRHIQFLGNELDHRKKKFADSLGMVNLSKFVTDSLD